MFDCTLILTHINISPLKYTTLNICQLEYLQNNIWLDNDISYSKEYNSDGIVTNVKSRFLFKPRVCIDAVVIHMCVCPARSNWGEGTAFLMISSLIFASRGISSKYCLCHLSYHWNVVTAAHWLIHWRLKTGKTPLLASFYTLFRGQ